ncbi:MAG: transcription elongation factor GreA [Frankiaceae bacterium]|jgi:transcription elongation factor GreA|nr:transcription elongation factor GreA [Frankiaceae bacterium]MDQ1635537.1 transcription elongation factor GreA [Frankiaceae bacterium]MDQ1671908.1 transcription elongation factor GreA [Frankiaceae bacterium]
MSQQQVWLTQEAYDRLRSEHEHLSGPGRAEIVYRINEAREEGDLKENGGYHAAKEEQGKQEARIRQLEQLLRNAKVGEAPANDGKAGPGMIVEVRFAGDTETERFVLGSREDHSTPLTIYSPQSPLGSAVTGHGPGETVDYSMPNGRSASVEIVAVEPYVA